ncbi:hypothetical protein E8E12_008002 [Didymella heteroderae]|uniref:Uncharacterized protein n=1 Tax=Didymella heteroderae TaxID=1769908 RepID=A0A9P5BZ09_9PLEO|nr:hypothetical protein E8E12_008002 [Didymella heteroderae]
MRLLITTAAFALASVVHAGPGGMQPDNATAEAAIHLMTFGSTDCNGPPQTGSPLEMENEQCINLHDPLSMVPMFWKGRRADWIDEVNKLHTHCKLEVFDQYNCNTHSRVVEYRNAVTDEQPKNFNKCLMPVHRESIKSARFICGPIENSEHLCTSILQHTLWSIEPTYGSAVPHVQEATYTGTLQVPASTPSVKVAPRGVALEHVAAAGESKGVWMLHPWSIGFMCYSCYTKKTNDYRKIECRSGKRFPIDCGPMPNVAIEGPTAYHTTTTVTTTGMTTTHSTSTAKTTTYKDDESSDSDKSTDCLPGEESVGLYGNVAKKSWHTPVKFPHPFLADTEACADAEWEKRGKQDEYIKIQHVHICYIKDHEDSKWLGLPTTVIHTATATKNTSRTFGHTTTSTSTATVGKATTTIIRHDQL